MNKLFFLRHFFLPAAFFSFIINMLYLAPTFYMMQLFARVVPAKSEELLLLLTGQLFLALLVVGALEVVRTRVLTTANNAIDAMLAPYVLKKMLEGAASPENNVYSYALNDLRTVRTFVTGGVIQTFDIPWLPIYMVLLYLMNPVLFQLLLAGSVIMIALAFASEYLTKRSLAQANEASRLAARFVDSALKNAEVVNAMGMVPSLTRRWARLNDRVITLQTGASNRAGGITGVTKFFRQFFQSMGMAAGAYVMLKDPTFSGGLMMAGGILFGKALAPLEFLISGWKGVLETRAAYSRLEEFFRAVQDNEPVLMELPPPTGQLSLERVTFGIRSTSKVIIKDVSFTLSAGEFLGIVGPSASGKSTLARLLVSVWKPVQGVIRMDGSNISDWPSDRLGRHVGYLPQDIELFAGSIAENIARLEEPDSEKVIAATTMAGLHDIILRMPGGYDAQIGEGGMILSGGQRQRLGLARALYGNPKLLVLDEPNASLDSAGELALLDAMVQLKKAGKTTVIITHNPSFLHHVDKLLVMQNGEVAVFGPKDQVLAQLQQNNSLKVQVAA